LAPATARLVSCGAEMELIVLTLACLSPEAGDRPKDGQAVADALTAYLDGVQERLQAAQRERAVALAREAEQRKRRKVQLALAATVLVAALGGAVGTSAYLMQAQKARSDQELRDAAEQARHGRNADAVAGLLDQAKEALQTGDATRAGVLLEAADQRAEEGGADDLAGRRARLRADLTVLNVLDEVDTFRWTAVEYTFPDSAAVAARFRAALRGFGL